MLHVHIISLGKLKESYWREAEAEYVKRLKFFLTLTIHEIKEESFSEKDPAEMIRRDEAVKLQNALEKFKGAFVIMLDEKGKGMDSVAFSSFLEERKMNGQHVVFVIGGPLGLDPEIKRYAHSILSFSQMTFTHQMMRVILLEQLYRSQMIAAGRTYHY